MPTIRAGDYKNNTQLKDMGLSALRAWVRKLQQDHNAVRLDALKVSQGYKEELEQMNDALNNALTEVEDLKSQLKNCRKGNLRGTALVDRLRNVIIARLATEYPDRNTPITEETAQLPNYSSDFYFTDHLLSLIETNRTEYGSSNSTINGLLR